MNKNVDFVIVGAGPVGISAAIVCIKKNLTYALVDKGCLVNSLYNYPKRMHFFSTAEKLEIGEIPFLSLGQKPTRDEALEYYRLVCKQWSIQPRLYEEVFNIKKEYQGFKVTTSKEALYAKAVIVCTGFYDIPHRLGVKGENLAHVFHYFNEAHPYLYSKVVVVGSANSAVDVALELYRKDCDVTLVTIEQEIGNRVKYWVKPDIENRIAKKEIKAFFNAQVQEITPSQVKVFAEGKQHSIDADFVFAMTGYEPNFSLMKKWGIHISKKNDILYSPQTLETNVKHLYVAGVIKGGMVTNKWFIENTRHDGETIVKHFLSTINS